MVLTAEFVYINRRLFNRNAWQAPTITPPLRYVSVRAGCAADVGRKKGQRRTSERRREGEGGERRKSKRVDRFRVARSLAGLAIAATREGDAAGTDRRRVSGGALTKQLQGNRMIPSGVWITSIILGISRGISHLQSHSRFYDERLPARIDHGTLRENSFQDLARARNGLFSLNRRHRAPSFAALSASRTPAAAATELVRTILMSWDFEKVGRFCPQKAVLFLYLLSGPHTRTHPNPKNV